jgi:hypothetical protein
LNHGTDGGEPKDWNPYSEWLAIPPSQTPPTHYRLLGLREFEADTDRIHRAALEQIARLRIHQTGEHVDLSQKLMNEVSMARVVLCDPVKKAEYDRQLRVGRAPDAAAETKPAAYEPPHEDEVEEAPSEDYDRIVVAERPKAPYRSRQTPSPFRTVVQAAIGTVAALGLLAAGLVAWNWISKFDLPATQPPPAPAQVIAIGPGAAEPPTAEFPLSTNPSTPPDPTPPAPSELNSAPSPDDVRRPEPLPGMQVAWESDLREQPQGMARPFDQNTGFGRDGMTLRADRPGRRVVYLPLPKGDFRLLVKLGDVELPSPHDGFSVGAVDANSDRTAACLRRDEGRWRFAVEKNGVAGAHSVVAPSPPGLWMEIRRAGDAWEALATGASAAASVSISDAPNAVALYIGLDVRTAQPARAVVAEARIETRDDSLAPRIAQWPATVDAPTGSARDRLFAATVDSDDDRVVSLSFDFEDSQALSTWTGRTGDDADGRIKLSPNATVDFGPIRNVRSFEWKSAFMERATKFRLDCDDGPSVVVDADRYDARVGKAVVSRFDSNDVESFQVLIYGVDEVGAIELNPALDRASRLPLGRPTLQVEAGEIHLEEFKITAEFDFERLWLSRLGDGDPGQVSGSHEVVRRLYRWPGEFDLTPGDVRPIVMANTPADEDGPHLSASGRDLYFRRTADGAARIHCVRRRDPSEWFDFETVLLGQSPETKVLSMALSADEKTAWIFAEVDGTTAVYERRRESPTAPFDPPKRINSLADASSEAKPVVVRDGLALMYSKEDSSGRQLIESTRPNRDEKFSAGRGIGVDGVYGHPTLTGDGLTMYVEGRVDGGKSAIFRLARATTESAWGAPEPVPELDSSTARKGDFSPFVTPDGEYLYFASDRDGGAGGLDLWVARLSRAAPEPAAPPPARRAGFWLTLGPVEIKEFERNRRLNELLKYFPTKNRRSPPQAGELLHGQRWQRSDRLSDGTGLYLVAHPFRVHNPVLNAAVEIVQCPGGAYFWFNGQALKFRNIAGLGQIEPWQSLSSGPVNKTSDSLKFTKSDHCLYGLICVPPQSDGKLEVRFLDLKTGETIEGIEPIGD